MMRFHPFEENVKCNEAGTGSAKPAKPKKKKKFDGPAKFGKYKGNKTRGKHR